MVIELPEKSSVSGVMIFFDYRDDFGAVVQIFSLKGIGGNFLMPHNHSKRKKFKHQNPQNQEQHQSKEWEYHSHPR